jgi:hypothetical protein
MLMRFPEFVGPGPVTTAGSGGWSDPAVWSPRPPADGDDVVIAAGHAVRYDRADGPALNALRVDGRLSFATDRPTRLRAVTVDVPPGGRLEVGTEADPVREGVTAEVVFLDRPIEPSRDPEQLGHGLLVRGTLTVCGRPKTPFARLAAAPQAGDVSLALAGPVEGWGPGDLLALADSRQVATGARLRRYEPWAETARLVEVRDGLARLDRPLAFDHPARDGGGGRLFPHVCNLTRNVVFRSEDPGGVRGHCLFTGRAEVDVCHAAFVGLGRTRADEHVHSTTFNPDGTVREHGTNQNGRYPIHFHLCHGPEPADHDGHGGHGGGTPAPPPGWQFRLEGCVVDGSPKWGVTLHDSHFGLVRGNVVWDCVGAGIVTEQGNETGNVVEGNYVGTCVGSGLPPDGRKLRPSHRVDMDGGHEGSGFWFRGPASVVRDNVAAGCRRAGFFFFSFGLPTTDGPSRVPRWPGADTAVDGQYELVRPDRRAPLAFEWNESYGCFSGFELWNVGMPDLSFRLTGLTAWHCCGFGLMAIYNRPIAVEWLQVLGDPAAPPDPDLPRHGVRGPGLFLSGLEVRGMWVGVRLNQPPVRARLVGDSLVERAVLAGNGADLVLPSVAAGYRCVRVVRDCSLSSTRLAYEAEYGTPEAAALDEVYVNGLRLYYSGSPLPPPCDDPAPPWLQGGRACPAEVPAVPLDLTPPGVRDVSFTSLPGGVLAVEWAADEPCRGTLVWGTHEDLLAGRGTRVDAGRGTAFAVRTPVGPPGARLHFLIEAADDAGNRAQSRHWNFQAKA